MNTEILANGNLKLTVDKHELVELESIAADDPDNFGCDDVMYEVFESFIVQPWDTK